MRQELRALLVAVFIGACLSLPGYAKAQEATVQERLGHPASARLLIIHADDFGMGHSVNRATIEAFEKGWITSASILVTCPWFPEVAEFARTHPEADLGIHLALNSEWTGVRWGPLSPRDKVPSLVASDGYLPLTGEEVARRARPAEVELELKAQIDWARAAGINLSHLDSHMFTLFRTPELLQVYKKMGATYNLPLLVERRSDRGGASGEALTWAVDAPGDALVDRVLSISPGVPIADWQAAYEKMLAPLPPGVYELIVHLAYSDDEMRGATWDHPDWGAPWRQADLDLVKSESFQKFLRDQKFILANWRDLGRLKQATPSSTR